MPPRFLSRDEVGTILSDTQTAAAGSMTATLAAGVGQRCYLSGFTVTGLGATAASSIEVVAAGLKFRVPIVAGATTPIATFAQTFDPPIPATADNTAVTVAVPSFGSGNTSAAVSAWGYRA